MKYALLGLEGETRQGVHEEGKRPPPPRRAWWAMR